MTGSLGRAASLSIAALAQGFGAIGPLLPGDTIRAALLQLGSSFVGGGGLQTATVAVYTNATKPQDATQAANGTLIVNPFTLPQFIGPSDDAGSNCRIVNARVPLDFVISDRERFVTVLVTNDAASGTIIGAALLEVESKK